MQYHIFHVTAGIKRGRLPYLVRRAAGSSSFLSFSSTKYNFLKCIFPNVFLHSVFSQSVFSQSLFSRSLFSHSVFSQNLFFPKVYFSKVYLFKVYFCKMYQTCFSSKALRVYLGFKWRLHHFYPLAWLLHKAFLRMFSSESQSTMRLEIGKVEVGESCTRWMVFDQLQHKFLPQVRASILFSLILLQMQGEEGWCIIILGEYSNQFHTHWALAVFYGPIYLNNNDQSSSIKLQWATGAEQRRTQLLATNKAGIKSSFLTLFGKTESAPTFFVGELHSTFPDSYLQ